MDALTINAGCYETYNMAQPPTTAPRGGTLELARLAKNAVNIPIISSGKLGYPDLAEQALVDGKLDFVALARYLLADPEWPIKVKEKRPEDIIPCIGCHEGCIARVRKSHYCSCAVNPATGIEKELAITPATTKKSVLIIGGGPAGMEAARVSTLRGHNVTLWEKTNVLGGNLIPAAAPDFKDDYQLLLEYLRTQMKKLDIDVQLNHEATVEEVQLLGPDIVFVATGAVHDIPDIEGLRNGIKSGHVVTAVDALLDVRKIGKTVVIVGGNCMGCETALFLANEDRNVTVVKRAETVAEDLVWGNAVELVKLLDDAKVQIMTDSHLVRISETGIDVTGEKSGNRSITADTVVYAGGMKSVGQELVDTLETKGFEVITLGDCIVPRKVMDAMWEGYRRARVV